MTEIRFYVNLQDPVGYACRLLRKAHGLGARVVVTGDAVTLARLDEALWTFSAQDFLPHARVGAVPPAILARTPIVMAPAPGDAPHRDLLVNLGGETPEGFEAFARLFELVGTDDAALAQARERWKFYKSRGYSVERHDTAAA